MSDDDDTPQLRRGLYDNLAAGNLEIAGETGDGDEQWRLTEQGVDRARTVIDRYIDGFDHPAEALAEAMDIPVAAAETIVAQRMKERAS